jgi:hypothetical protein
MGLPNPSSIRPFKGLGHPYGYGFLFGLYNIAGADTFHVTQRHQQYAVVFEAYHFRHYAVPILPRFDMAGLADVYVRPGGLDG